MWSVGQRINIEFLENQVFIVVKHMEGGMGDVYKVVDPTLVTSFAVKTFKQCINASDFKNECQIFVTAALHDSCVKPVGYGLIDSHPAIAYHWYSSTLAEQNSKNWKPDEILIFLDNLMSFFQYTSSELQVLHCDIKPSNILINANRKPFVSDFGISKILSGLDQLNATHRAAGTREYMAPELFFTNIHTVKSELYSFGVTIYEFLTGEHPHLNEYSSETNLKKITKNFKVLHKRLGKPIAPYLDYIEKCISFESAKRPESFSLNEKSNFSDKLQRQDQNRNLIDSICVKSSYYRKEKNYELAEKIIHDAIESHGKHPALLNALAATYLCSRSRIESIPIFEEASKLLFNNNCILDSIIYLDPIINLCAQYRCEKRYDEAHATLNRAWKIYINYEKRKFMYAEFGWMMMYEGNFTEACLYFKKCFESRSVQPFEMYCFTEAAWISGGIEKYADFILKKVIYNNQFNEPYFLCAFLLSVYSSSEATMRMTSMLNDQILRAIENLEKQDNLPDKSLRPPKDPAFQISVILGIDQVVTGGKFKNILEHRRSKIISSK
jgi:serine/threonine protein kinase